MSELQSIIEKTIESGPHLVSVPDGLITFAIIASDDAHMCQLNGDFRDKPDPTNVLSFPDGTFEEIEGEFHLGDIFLGYEIIKSEAEKQDIPLRNHLLHLIVHGILHLLGYDHQEEHQAQIMEQKEVLLLSLFNIPDPYSL
jgi:probable rRNA maturation factor